MRKALSLIAIALLLVSLSSCKSNMRRDVKRLAHKTEQCFSKLDINDIDNCDKEEFNSCYEELEKLMNQYDKKYSDPEQSVKFGKMYVEELEKSDLPDEFKEIFRYFNTLYQNGVDLAPSEDISLEEEDTSTTAPVVI